MGSWGFTVKRNQLGLGELSIGRSSVVATRCRLTQMDILEGDNDGFAPKEQIFQRTMTELDISEKKAQDEIESLRRRSSRDS